MHGLDVPRRWLHYLLLLSLWLVWSVVGAVAEPVVRNLGRGRRLKWRVINKLREFWQSRTHTVSVLFCASGHIRTPSGHCRQLIGIHKGPANASSLMSKVIQSFEWSSKYWVSCTKPLGHCVLISWFLFVDKIKWNEIKWKNGWLYVTLKPFSTLLTSKFQVISNDL